MKKVAVIGLGYVGLPLALQFAKHFPTVGYDISETKIIAYRNLFDPSNEVSLEEFQAAYLFEPTTDILAISDADFIIIAMPTPVDEENVPDFACLISVSSIVGANMKSGAIVIYESTVYPGATEEICIPILEQASGLIWKQDFFVGYSPERISPGEKVMSLTKLTKIVSGDTRETLGSIAELYETIIIAGVYKAASIRVAEAAKIVENIQRDVNIALMNELSTIFHRLDLDTNEVIDAAASKWNFANYRPGLVGGHCISVDPYYLINKAATVGHSSSFLNSTREINNAMAKFVVKETTKDIDPIGKKVAVFGLTFKENCSDIRNSKVFDLIKEYQNLGMEVFAFDYMVNPMEVEHEYGIKITNFDDIPQCDIVVLASPHTDWVKFDADALVEKTKIGGLFVDIKGRFNKAKFINSPYRLWRL